MRPAGSRWYNSFMNSPIDTARIVYVDVDDTFVRTFGSKRIPITPVIDHVRALFESGAELYCWSSGGADYARICATEFGIADCFRGFLPKPQVMIDDQLIADWRGLMQVHPNECAGSTVDRYAGIVPAMRSSISTGRSPSPHLVHKIGLIGDVHAQDDLLEIALTWLGGVYVDAILCTGDIVDGTGDAERCFALLEKHGVVAVRGNHDRWLANDNGPAISQGSRPVELSKERVLQLRLLPPTLSFVTPAGRLLLCHGLGKNDLRELRYGDSDSVLESNLELQQLRKSEYAIVINGHTHERMVRDYDGVVVINAGTLRIDRDSVFATVDFDERVVQYYGFDDERQVVSRDEYAF